MLTMSSAIMKKVFSFNALLSRRVHKTKIDQINARNIYKYFQFLDKYNVCSRIAHWSCLVSSKDFITGSLLKSILNGPCPICIGDFLSSGSCSLWLSILATERSNFLIFSPLTLFLKNPIFAFLLE